MEVCFSNSWDPTGVSRILQQQSGVNVDSRVTHLRYQPWLFSAAWDDWKTLGLESIARRQAMQSSFTAAVVR